MPIPPDSDPRKRRAMKAATVAASSGSSQMEGSRAVAETPTQQNSMADGSRMDVEGEETETEGTEHQTTNNDEMDEWTKEKKEMNSEVRQYRIPGDELRQKTSQEENNSDERTVASDHPRVVGWDP